MLRKIFPLLGILVILALALPTDLTAPTTPTTTKPLPPRIPGQNMQKINMPPIVNATDVNVIYQNFDTTWSTAIPPIGWTIRYDGTLGASDWGRNNYIWGPGPGNASINWSPSETGDDSMYTPTINLTGMQNVVFNCTSYYDHYSGAYTAQFRGSINGGATYPYLIYDFNQTTQTVGLHIPLAWAAGQANVKILFLGSGATFNMNWWAVDEFSVTADPSVGLDLATLRIVGPSGLISAGPVTPQAWVKNYGTGAAPACSVKFDITPGYTSTMPVPALLSGDSSLISFASWTAAAGSFVTKCSTRLPGDLFTGNDKLTGSVSVASFVKDFEANDGNFVAQGAGQWQWGTSTKTGGPSAAHSGTKLWATLLATGYPDGADWHLWSCTFIASAANPTLMYYDWWSTEASWDGYNVSLSTDNGQSWTLITPVGGYNYSSVYGLGEAGFSGTQTSWQLKTFIIPITAGTVFKLRWRFGSDPSVSGFPGVFIDDVAGVGFAPLIVTNDVGVAAILVPGASAQIGSTIQPKGLVKNYGVANQTNVPVTCWVDSLGTRIFTGATTVNVLAGDTATATFANWTVGTGPQYDVTMFTALSNDSLMMNDTLRKTIDAIPWGEIAKPGATPDRLSHGLAYDPVNDKIYMMGGTPNGNSGTNVNLMQQYDPVANTWTDKATMPTAKGWIDGEYCRGYIYAIGGYNNSAAAITENARYDIAANTWTTRAARPRIAACDFEVTWRDTLIYVMGGTNLSVGWNFVDIYNPFTNTWSLGTAMPTPGDMGSAVILGDTIYITNALNRGSSSCWPNLQKGAINPANPNQIAWSAGPAFTYPTFDAGSAVARGNPYWLGGFVGATSVTNQSWYYDRASGTIVDFYNYPVALSRCCYMVSRPSAREFFVMAGDQDGNWAAPNQTYYKVSFPPTHDVGVTYLNVPATVAPGASVAPACSVYNFGEVAETFRVRAKIGTVYNETLQVSGLAIGAGVGLTFPSWTSVTGNYTVSCSTELGNDINNANDKLSAALEVLVPPPAGWATLAPIPTTPSGKNPKAGSCMAGLEATGMVYFLKASNKSDFAAFTPDPSGVTPGVWVDKDTFPKGDKATFDGKYPKKGASMAAYDPTKCLYVLRGNNTQGFWKYQADTLAGDTASIGWKKQLEIPLGAKAPKDASGMALVTKNDTDYLFTMKGSKTDEFYFYNIEANTWSAPLPAPAAGTSGKIGYKKGSCLAYDGEKTVYVLKGNYGDFFKFDIDSLKWTELTRYDKKIFINRDGKKKAPKDGAALVFHNDFIYMLKGGNTRELWKYNTLADTGTWVQMNPDNIWDIPLGGGKKVKGGGAMIKFGNFLYASKGGNTQEFYGHGVPVESVATVNYMAKNGALGNKVANEFSLTVAPNPAINVTAIRYNLPAAGAVSFKLYNVAGSLVKTYTNAVPTKNGLITIDAKALPSGVYILRFNAGDIRVTRKLVLEK